MSPPSSATKAAPVAGGPRTVAELILAEIAAALALWVVLSTLATIHAGYSALPYWDEWDPWHSYLRQGHSLSWFFALHNDHRIAVPRLFFALDHLLFGGRRWFLMILSCCLQAALGAMLWRLSARAFRQEQKEGLVLGAAIIACLFSAQQLMNFIWCFQVQFFLVYIAGAGALFSLLKAAGQREPHRRTTWMLASILMAAASTYSMMNGLLIWPVLLLTAVWLRIGARQSAAIAAAALLAMASYFYRWHPSILDAPAPWWRTLAFALANMGSPVVPAAALLRLGTSSRVICAIVVGGLLSAGAAAAFLRLWLHREKFNAAQAVLLHFAVFVAAASFAIALGRSHLPLAEAFRTRYLTPPYILWLCCLIGIWPRLRRVRAAALYVGVCAALLAGIAIPQLGQFGVANWLALGYRRGEMAVAAGVLDPVGWSSVYDHPEIALDVIDYLKLHRLSIFNQEWTHWPGLRLSSRFTIDSGPNACQGGFEETVAIPSLLRPGWSASGWAFDLRARAAPRFVIFTDDAANVAGIGRVAVAPSAGAPMESAKWLGYIARRPKAVTAYVVEADGKSVCPIGTRVLSPAP
jgi:hypothetical protein